MIKGLDHIAIIASSEASIEFYTKLGFTETERIMRNYDTIVFMECAGIKLEIFVDPNHPNRVTNPEALGLRHIALKVASVKEYLKDFTNITINQDWHGVNYAFIKDPDGLPIEIHE